MGRGLYYRELQQTFSVTHSRTCKGIPVNMKEAKQDMSGVNMRVDFMEYHREVKASEGNREVEYMQVSLYVNLVNTGTGRVVEIHVTACHVDLGKSVSDHSSWVMAMSKAQVLAETVGVPLHFQKYRFVHVTGSAWVPMGVAHTYNTVTKDMVPVDDRTVIAVKDGKFGFSTLKEAWEDTGGRMLNDMEEKLAKVMFDEVAEAAPKDDPEAGVVKTGKIEDSALKFIRPERSEDQ